MKYIGYFKNINEVNYSITFNCSQVVGADEEIILATEPIKVEYTSSNLIYEPIKNSNATISIITNTILSNLYSSELTNVIVELKNTDTNTLEWVGYVNPVIYTQPFDDEYNQIEIECSDGLSILSKIEYTPVDTNIEVQSFHLIILNILKKCGIYNLIYENKNLQIALENTYNIFTQLHINEQNFYSDDAEPEAWKCDEVLKHILQYTGCNIIAWKGIVYIYDLDYIKKGNSNYAVYDIFSNNFIQYQTIDYNYNINANTIKETSGSLELLPTFNKIGIETSLYFNEDILPEFFNDDNLENITTDENGTNWNSYIYRYIYGYESIDDNKSFLFKYYKDKNWINTYYDNDINWNEIEVDTLSFDDVYNNIGCTFFRQGEYPLTFELPKSITFTDYIMLHRHLQSNPTSAQNVSKEVLRLKPYTIKNTTILEDNYFIMIDCEALWESREVSDNINAFPAQKIGFVPPKLESRSNDDLEHGLVENNLYITCQLSIGNKYWTGTNWTTTPSIFYLYFEMGEETHFTEKWFKIKSDINYFDGFNSTALKIPIKKSDGIMGDINFAIYSPKSVMDSYRTEYVWLKGLTIEIMKPNFSKDDETDTKYENIVNENYINEFSNLDFKVCSHTNKGLNNGAVIKKDLTSNVYEYVETLYDSSLNTTQLQEYNIIEKYINQYSAPCKKFSFIINSSNATPLYTYTLNTLFPDEKYIIDSMNIDYIYNKCEVSIIEKK